ncbi:hypothetical protein [Streptomyces sp. NPDC059009]|uniref:hypothetical protein n=1 Tax=Streptomyces sp. NPDC059009 TaxID=3346694 RepID=UPI0036ABFE06
MNRPLRLTTAALIASAALLLTSCGSDDKPKDDDKIAGAGKEKKTPSPSASKEVAGRPKIELPSDLHYAFAWPKTGDAAKDAVLSDSQQSIQAVDLAIANQNALDKAYRFYYEGEAAAGTQEFIQKYVDQKFRTTGTYRFYKPNVTVRKDGAATFSYCEDQSRAFARNVKTNKVNKTPVTKKSYVVYNTSLRKNKQGVWVIQKIVSQSGSAQCQP